MGRLLEPDDDAQRRQVVVISYGYWMDKLGGQVNVLNDKLIVNGQPFTVVGVLPKGFTSMVIGQQPDVFAPLTHKPSLTPGWNGTDRRDDFWLYCFGRLQDGQTVEAAQQRFAPTMKALLQEDAKSFNDREFRGKYSAQTARLTLAGKPGGSIREEGQTALQILMVTTLLVLAIACANVANLLLARAATRGKELAIRVAIGAGRWPIFRQMLVESVTLSVSGAIVGLMVGWWTLALLVAMLARGEGNIYFIDTNLDLRTLLFTAALGVASGLVFGLYPAWTAARISVAGTLKDAANQSGSTAAARVRKMLVVAQVALALLLLVSAGLFAKSLYNINRVEMGMNITNVIGFGVSPDLNGYSPDRIQTLFTEAESRLRAIPGVTGATTSLIPLLGGNSWGTDVWIEGQAGTKPINGNSRLNDVGPGYFRTMGVPLVAGREFTEADNVSSPKVVVVNERFVSQFLKGRQPLGTRISVEGRDKFDVEIVGVVRDSKYSSVKAKIPPIFYSPWRQTKRANGAFLYVRTSQPPEQTVASIRRVMAQLDPNLPLEELRTVEEQAQVSTVNDRMVLNLAASFALVATALAMLGLYGVMAYTVACRTREIGIRMALGAERETIRSLVLKDVAVVCGVGAVIGLPAAYFAVKVAESLLFGVKANDWVVFSLAVVLLGLAALAAGYVPARRATNIDPMVALRYE